MAQRFARPAQFAIDSRPCSRVEVSRSGDIGYTIGTYEGTWTQPDGKSVKDRGKYLEVWKKQPDGKWKCVADMYSSDRPAAQ